MNKWRGRKVGGTVFGDASVPQGEVSIGKFMLWQLKIFPWSYLLSLSPWDCEGKMQNELKELIKANRFIWRYLSGEIKPVYLGGGGIIYFASDIYLTFFKTRHLNSDLNFISNHLTSDPLLAAYCCYKLKSPGSRHALWFYYQCKYCVTHILPWGESQLGKTFSGITLSLKT